MAITNEDRTARIILSIAVLSAVIGSCVGEVTAEDDGRERSLFILGKYKSVIKSEEGQVKVVHGYRRRGDPNPMHIGFVEMEPDTLLIPQYMDANLIIFVRNGQADVGCICKDRMVERRLRPGDIIVIPAGSAFYVINGCKDQRLQIIASIDSAESSGFGSNYPSFFIGGGNYPTSILSGFDTETITAALNVTTEELDEMMSQSGGPIIPMNPRGRNIRTSNDGSQGVARGDFFGSVLGWLNLHRAHDAYNIYDRKPDFRNEYGWSVAVDENEYAPLKDSGIGVYLVDLAEGSMMAPHVNPTATEYGVVLDGVGTLQVVFPNGTSAANVQLSAGDVFWVPRYFPFCQLASRGGPLRFFGFTTSSKKNRPQFLAGRRSVLRALRGEVLAVAFNVSVHEMDRVLKAQREEVILPMRRVPTPAAGEEVVMMSRRFMFA